LNKEWERSAREWDHRFLSLLSANERSLSCAGPGTTRPVVRDNIFSSKGIHVGIVDGRAIFDLNGQKLYDLKGKKIYRLTGELVGHLNAVSGSERRLDRFNDRLFPRARY
jgi:hypothetical protein